MAWRASLTFARWSMRVSRSTGNKPWGVNAMGFEPRMFDAMAGDASLADFASPDRTARRPIPFDTTIIHFTPDQWLRFRARAASCRIHDI